MQSSPPPPQIVIPPPFPLNAIPQSPPTQAYKQAAPQPPPHLQPVIYQAINRSQIVPNFFSQQNASSLPAPPPQFVQQKLNSPPQFKSQSPNPPPQFKCQSPNPPPQFDQQEPSSKKGSSQPQNSQQTSNQPPQFKCQSPNPPPQFDQQEPSSKKAPSQPQNTQQKSKPYPKFKKQGYNSSPKFKKQSSNPPSQPPSTQQQEEDKKQRKKKRNRRKNRKGKQNNSNNNNNNSLNSSNSNDDIIVIEEEEEEEIHFCPHLFECGLAPEKHPWLYHICKWDGRDCTIPHTEHIIHFENDPCPYGTSCTLIEDPVHRARFYHRGLPLYMTFCKNGPACHERVNWNHRAGFQHLYEPFVPVVTGSVSSLLISQQGLVLRYCESGRVFLNRKSKEIVKDVGCSGDDKSVLPEWESYCIQDEIVCRIKSTNREFLLEPKSYIINDSK